MLSQAAFARYIGRSPGLVSQWKASGKLTADCFGKDEKGRDVVLVPRALEVLRGALDPIQQVANGKPLPDDDVGLPLPGAAPASTDILPRNTLTPRTVSATEELTRERLRAAKLDNEDRERKRRLEAGIYIATSEVGVVFAQTLEQMLAQFDLGLRELAETLAAEHGTESKAELFIVRNWWRGQRERVSQHFQAMADRLPEAVVEGTEGSADDGNSASQPSAPSGDDSLAGDETEAAA